MKEITARQKEILDFIIFFYKKNGFMPAVREISSNFGISSKGAFDHLIALEKKGFILRNGGHRKIIINSENIEVNPDREAIQNFNKFVRTSRIMKKHEKGKKCIICGSEENVHRHHEDYSKPNDFFCLCLVHHKMWHRFKNAFERNEIKIHF
jgi:SOS-response transcriptional repressor LexA